MRDLAYAGGLPELLRAAAAGLVLLAGFVLAASAAVRLVIGRAERCRGCGRALTYRDTEHGAVLGCWGCPANRRAG